MQRKNALIDEKIPQKKFLKKICQTTQSQILMDKPINFFLKIKNILYLVHRYGVHGDFVDLSRITLT